MHCTRSVLIFTLCIQSVSLSLCATDYKKMKLFKTDQGTWNTKWFYGFSEDDNTLPAAHKTIKKEVNLSVHPDTPVLLICSDAGGCNIQTYKKINLSSHMQNNTVIALDTTGMPRFSTAEEMKEKLSVKTMRINVYKKVDDKKRWTIQAVSPDDRPYWQPIRYGKITIKKDTSGFARKLTIPLNLDWDLKVARESGNPVITKFRKDPQAGQLSNKLSPDAILVILTSGQGIIKKKGEEPQ